MWPVTLSDSEEEQQGAVDAERQSVLEALEVEEEEEELATQMMRDQMEEPVPLSQHRAPAAAPAGYTRVSLRQRRPKWCERNKDAILQLKVLALQRKAREQEEKKHKQLRGTEAMKEKREKMREKYATKKQKQAPSDLSESTEGVVLLRCIRGNGKDIMEKPAA